MAYCAAVTWEVRRGAEGRIAQIIEEMSSRTRAEPGCLVYQPHRSVDRPDVFFIYEQFTDEAAFSAHLESAHYQRLVLGEAVPLLAHRERHLYIATG